MRWNGSVKDTLEMFKQSWLAICDSYNGLLPLHQVIGWKLSHIKFALAIKAMLVFLPLTVVHGLTARRFSLDDTRA